MGVKLVSSSGGSVELVAPTTASNYTATMPANTGTVITTASTFAGTGPAFSASISGTQAVTQNTWTKVTLNSKSFDTASCFDATTNYRFTPTVAGYYQLNGNGQINATGSFTGTTVIYKNGSAVVSANSWGGTDYPKSNPATLVYANGSTDYFELYIRQDSAGSQNVTTASFSGALVRAA